MFLEMQYICKRKKESGVAFLETVVVAGMMAGIMIALVYGIHNLSTTSIDKDMHLTGSYSQAIGLLNAVDKDFANSDRVIFFRDQTGLQAVATANYNFDASLLRSEGVAGFNNEVSGGVAHWSPPRALTDPTWYNELLALNSPIQPVLPRPNHWELHFLQGDKVLSVLTVNFTASVLTYNRHTRSSAAPIQSFSTTDASVILPLMSQGPITFDTSLQTLTVRIPNPRESDTATNLDYEEPLEIIRAAN